MDNFNFQADVMKSATVIKLGSGQAFDRCDPDTRLRFESLPPWNPRFHTHPSPDA